MKTRLPDLESIDQTAKATAARLSQSAAAVAYELFRDREFRRMAGLERLSQTEEDRIFNELVVGFIRVDHALTRSPGSPRLLRTAKLSRWSEQTDRRGARGTSKDLGRAIRSSERLGKAHFHAPRGICARQARGARGGDADRVGKKESGYGRSFENPASPTGANCCDRLSPPRLSRPHRGQDDCSIGSLNLSPSSTSSFECPRWRQSPRSPAREWH